MRLIDADELKKYISDAVGRSIDFVPVKELPIVIDMQPTMNDRCLFKAKHMNVMPCNSHLVSTWAKGFLCSENYINTGEAEFLIDRKTLCQCTGLKDKNGTLIWENDVVKCIDRNSEAEFIAVVEFGNPNGEYSWGYQLRHIKGDKPNLDILLWVEMEETGATIEVQGNIFDNPELLEMEPELVNLEELEEER